MVAKRVKETATSTRARRKREWDAEEEDPEQMSINPGEVAPLLLTVGRSPPAFHTHVTQSLKGVDCEDVTKGSEQSFSSANPSCMAVNAAR